MLTMINIKRLGLATGLTFVLLYVGCMVVMATVGREGTLRFLNSLFHGVDFSSLIRMRVSLTEACIGIGEMFILGWLVGACVAALYNLNFKS